MTEAAGAVCRRAASPTPSPPRRYLREVTRPALERGAPSAGRRPSRGSSRLSGPRSSSPRATTRAGSSRRADRRPPASRSPSTARRPPTVACSTSMAGVVSKRSSTRCPSRASGSRWARRSTTTSSIPLRWSPSPTRSRPSCRFVTATSSTASASLRRPVEPRGLASGDERPQGGHQVAEGAIRRSRSRSPRRRGCRLGRAGAEARGHHR